MKTCFWKGSYSSLRERLSIPEKFNVMVVEVNLDRYLLATTLSSRGI